MGHELDPESSKVTPPPQQVRQDSIGYWLLHGLVIALVALAFLSLFQSSIDDSSLNVSRVAEAVLLLTGVALAGLVCLARPTWRLLTDSPGIRIMSLFCGFACLSAFWAPSSSLAVSKSCEVAVMTLIAALVGHWAAVNLSSAASLATMISWVLLFVITAMLAYNIPLYGTPFATQGIGTSGRLMFAYSHPLTGADLIALDILAVLVSTMRLRIRIVCLSYLGVIFSLTHPRGALGCLVIAILSMTFVWLKRGSYRFFATSGVLLSILAVCLAYGPDLPLMLNRWLPADAPSLNGRTELWAYVMKLIPEAPFSGYGYYSSRALLLTEFPWAGHTHNVYLEMMLTLGAPGLALCLAMMARSVQIAIRTRNLWLTGAAAYCFSISILDPMAMGADIPMFLLLLALFHTRAVEILKLQEAGRMQGALDKSLTDAGI